MSLIQKKIDGKERSQEEAWEEILYDYNSNGIYGKNLDKKTVFNTMVKVFNRSIGAELSTHEETV